MRRVTPGFVGDTMPSGETSATLGFSVRHSPLPDGLLGKRVSCPTTSVTGFDVCNRVPGVALFSIGVESTTD
jgi:hypothetical protein